MCGLRKHVSSRKNQLPSGNCKEGVFIISDSVMECNTPIDFAPGTWAEATCKDITNHAPIHPEPFPPLPIPTNQTTPPLV